MAIGRFAIESKTGNIANLMNVDPHSNEAGTSSPVSFALAQLDHSIRAVQEQLDGLRAGLNFDEEQLRRSLTTAFQHSTTVCDLIRAERPDAGWEDRQALERLIQQLEMAAAARKNQQRRSRLVELAKELDAGTIKHRLETRTAALNSLRLQAVKELRTEAAFSEQSKVLPGPSAGLWLRWACNLDEEKDADALATLHQDFIALERFTGEMDESYWIPARRAHEDAEDAAEPPIRPVKTSPGVPPAAASAKPAPAGTAPGKPSSDVREQVVSAIHNGNYGEALSLCYEPGSTEAVAKAEAAAQAPELASSTASATPAASVAASAASPAPVKAGPKTKRRGRDRKSHWVETAVGASAAAKAQTVTAEQPPAGAAEPTLLKTVKPSPEPSNGAGGRELAATPAEAAEEEIKEPLPTTATEEPFTTLTAAAGSRKPVIAWAAAATFIVLSAIIFGVIYHLHGNSSAKAGETVAAAGPNADTAASTAAPALLNKQPAEGAQNKILLTVEHCGHGSAGNTECWGYVSNQGNDSSKVSLNRADVVDGKGNSFSVEHSQLTFATGQSSAIPAGSRAKYTVNIPDKDKDARTFTLYIDLSSPHGLEYTFRDVPVVD